MSNKIYHSFYCKECGAKILAWLFRPVQAIICPDCQSTMNLRDQRSLGREKQSPVASRQP